MKQTTHSTSGHLTKIKWFQKNIKYICTVPMFLNPIIHLKYNYSVTKIMAVLQKQLCTRIIITRILFRFARGEFRNSITFIISLGSRDIRLCPYVRNILHLLTLFWNSMQYFSYPVLSTIVAHCKWSVVQI